MCESGQRGRYQRHDPPCWSCTLESQYSGTKRKKRPRLPTVHIVPTSVPCNTCVYILISVCKRYLDQKVQRRRMACREDCEPNL